MKNKLTILKIGGKVLANPNKLQLLLQQFAAMEDKKILVHGGGKKASEVLQKMGITPKMHEGRRITDEATLEVAVMVYAGLMNKTVVSQLQAQGCNAIGMTGADFNCIEAHKRIVKDIDYGFAGDIDQVNTDSIKALLNIQATPVFCAITHDKKGQLLNTNADTIAATLASELAAQYEVQLILCFEKPGVLLDAEDDGSIIDVLDQQEYQSLKTKGIIFAGMIPKLDNAFSALAQGVAKVVVGGTDEIGKGTSLKLG